MSARLDLAYWYVDFATNQLRLAKANFKKVRFPETVDCAQDAIEFAIKALFEFAGRRYPRTHDLGTSIPNLSSAFPGLAYELSRAAVASSHWLGTARNIPRYGHQSLGVAPSMLYRKTQVRQALSDAEEVYRLLLSIVKQQKLQPLEKVALLNGYVEGPRFREQPCAIRPYNNFPATQWRQALNAIQLPNGHQKYQVSEIPASKVNSQYAMIINPFGEAYPENDVESRPTFSRIKDYVWGGGLFVNAGGFAFFYAWDVKRGQRIPISERRILVPSTIAVRPSGQVIIQQFRSALEFTGTLLWKELGALTTGDTQAHHGAFSMPTRQNRSDINKVGNLRSLGGTSTVSEFRSLRGGTKNLVPLLRGTRPGFGNVFPIAAIKYGYGYFLICGMNLASSVEFDKSVAAADRFLEWVLH